MLAKRVVHTCTEHVCFIAIIFYTPRNNYVAVLFMVLEFTCGFSQIYGFRII